MARSDLDVAHARRLQVDQESPRAHAEPCLYLGPVMPHHACFRRARLACALGLLASFAGPTLASSALAHDPKEEEEELKKEAAERPAHPPKQAESPIEITITAEKPGGESSSRIVIGKRELELRPR